MKDKIIESIVCLLIIIGCAEDKRSGGQTDFSQKNFTVVIDSFAYYWHRFATDSTIVTVKQNNQTVSDCLIKGSYLDASFDESGEVFLDFEGDSAIIINLTDIDVNKRHNLLDLNDTTYAGYTSEQIIQAAVEYHKMNHP